MPTFYFENQHGRKEGRLIAGCDEAGRGPLAGPVVAAAVIIPEKFPAKIAKRLDDSKKLERAEREALYPEILHYCACAITQAHVAEIDTFNILQASLLAMSRAVAALQKEVEAQDHLLLVKKEQFYAIDVVLVDGNRPPILDCKVQAIIGGDGRSLSIAAASVLAKVTRDRIMRKLAEEFPHYGFEQHVGYGTPFHLAALEKHGPCAHHRQSFAPVRQAARVA
jgi:ribonuclease HII